MKKPVAQKSRKAASAKDGFNAVWIDLLPRLSARFKNPEVFREAYQRLFLMGFKPAPAPEDNDEFDLCNVLCGHWEINKPLPIQVSFEPMHNGKLNSPFALNPTFTYPNKDWVEGIRKVKTKGPKKTPAVFWLKAFAEEENLKAKKNAPKKEGKKKTLPVSIPEDEPNDELRLALQALEFDRRAELGDLCQRALTDSDPEAFQRFERLWQAASILREKPTKDQLERITRARRFIECFERLCLKKGFPPTKRALREACRFKVDDPNPAKVRVMDEAQFRREYLNAYGLYWLPAKHP